MDENTLYRSSLANKRFTNTNTLYIYAYIYNNIIENHYFATSEKLVEPDIRYEWLL